MHGLIYRSFESFVRNTYGVEHWCEMASALDAGVETFEPMLHYDDALAQRLVDIAAQRLAKPREVLLEDFGTYLVAHPASERLRRLLRFGGVDYEDFLASLEDLSGRARLAVPDLDLPALDLVERGRGEYLLNCRNFCDGFTPVFRGLLRALADDYGALVLIESAGGDGGAGAQDRLVIHLLEADFAEGRGFALAGQPAVAGKPVLTGGAPARRAAP